jgi:hypothetical protein
VDQVRDGRLQAVDPGHQVRVAGRVGVEAQRRERRAQPVRQVRDPFPLGGPQLVDPIRQQVERPGGVGQLRRRAGSGAGLRRARGQCPGRGRQLGGVAGHRSGQAVGDEGGRRHQRDRHARQCGPRRRHPVVEQAFGDAGPDHRDVGVAGPGDDDRVQLAGSVAVLAERASLVARQGQRLLVVGRGVAEPGAVGEPHGEAPVGACARPGHGGPQVERREDGEAVGGDDRGPGSGDDGSGGGGCPG